MTTGTIIMMSTMITIRKRRLIRVMRRQDMTKKITKSKTNTKTKTMTYTFREHPQRALETCDLRLDT